MPCRSFFTYQLLQVSRPRMYAVIRSIRLDAGLRWLTDDSRDGVQRDDGSQKKSSGL